MAGIARKDPSKDPRKYPSDHHAPFVFPKDILDELRKDESVWENYQKFSEPYKRIRVAYVDAARKRPDEFQKRLKSFIDKTRQNKIIRGFGGIEKYY